MLSDVEHVISANLKDGGGRMATMAAVAGMAAPPLLGGTVRRCRSTSAMPPDLAALFGMGSSSAIPSLPTFKQRRGRGAPVQLQIFCSEDLDQMKQMAAAQKRWESQVKEGKVKSLSPKEAGYAVQLSKYTLLDVRPSSERSKAWVKGSVWVPIFDVDKSLDPGTVFKKLSNLAMGGWWSGLPLMKYNERFMPDVVARIPKSANVIVACQRGLRSLSACEQLYKAGYRNIYWLNGGLDAAEEGDFEREGPQPFSFAGIGGVSEFLGWTDVQRKVAAKEGVGYRVLMFGRLVLVVLAVDSVFIGAQQIMQRMQEMRQ